MDSSKNHWLCIDFGTCNTAAAFLVGGKPHLVSYGNSSFFPTVACVLESGEIQVCQNAEPLRDRFPEFFQQEFKLQIADPVDINGHSYEDIVAEIQSQDVVIPCTFHISLPLLTRLNCLKTESPAFTTPNATTGF